MSDFKHLLSPLQVGTKTLKNRVMNAPRGGIWTGDLIDGIHVDPEQIADAVVKCRGGVAVYEIGETAVSPSGARGANEYYSLTDFSEDHTACYREYAAAIHENGALAMVELAHMGQAKPESEPDAPAYGPVDCINEAGEQVTGMDQAAIDKTCEEFANAAFFMQKNGYDGVNVHCGHGWLIHQFLSPRYNTRTDLYGGNAENRARFGMEVCKAIREKCGKDFIIEVRISGRENMEGGYSLEDIITFCKAVQDYADLIHVSAGVYQKPMETLQNSTLYDAHGCNVEVAAEIKKQVQIPVAVVGGINSPEDAERFLAEGKCDAIVLCRQLQADPNFVAKTMAGKPETIRKCLRCMRCYPGPFEEAWEELNGEFPEGCSVNPYLLHFDENDPAPADVAKKLLIIGGGCAGMQTAITAVRRGHKVTLLEKSMQLGGILNFAKDDKDKYDLKALADSMAAEVKELAANEKLTLLLGSEATAEMMKEAEEVVIATGSSTLKPPIAGIEYCVSGIDAYKPETPIADSVVMLGGGLVGAETAVHLSRQGKKVTIVEMRDSLAPDAYRLHKHKLRQIIAADENITVLLEGKCLSIEKAETLGNAFTVKVEKDGAVQNLSAGTVIAALGMKSNPTEALEAMAKEAGVSYHVIGDAKRARKIYDAIEEGYVTAMEL